MAGILEAELGRVEDVFAGLTAAEWATATRLVPFDPARPHSTLFELAGHSDISIGLTSMLIADPSPGSRSATGSVSSSSRDQRSAGILRLRLHDGRRQDACADAGCPARDVRQDRPGGARRPARHRRPVPCFEPYLPCALMSSSRAGSWRRSCMAWTSPATGPPGHRHAGRHRNDRQPSGRVARPARCPRPPGRPR